jgi:hypothetical protein
MTLQLINPRDLPTPLTYSHVAVATAGGARPGRSPRSRSMSFTIGPNTCR